MYLTTKPNSDVERNHIMWDQLSLGSRCRLHNVIDFEGNLTSSASESYKSCTATF